jgi:hypothetical protein
MLITELYHRRRAPMSETRQHKERAMRNEIPVNGAEVRVTYADGPQGAFVVSTIQTYAGGADNDRPLGSPFSTADYADETPWSYETMVFKAHPEYGQRGGTHFATGQFHRAYASRRAARRGHERITRLCESGILPVGDGVRGPFGVPTLTATDWRRSPRAAPFPAHPPDSRPSLGEPPHV